MQGTIASLLALMMTGMVFSQQPQSNNFASSQTENPQLLGRYLLIVDQNVVQSLKTHGFRSANIAARDRPNVDHIVLHASEINAQSQDLEPVDIQPVPPMDGEDGLVFELNDHYLSLLQRRGLIYILRPEDIGRFRILTIKYDDHQQIGGTLPPARPEQSFSTGPMAADTRVNGQGGQFARNGTDEFGAPFYGPSLPDDWNGRSGTQRINENDSFRPRLGTIATRRQQPTNLQPLRDRYPRDLQQNSMINSQAATRNQFNQRVASNTPFDDDSFRTGSQMPAVNGMGNQNVQPSTLSYDPELRNALRIRDAENRSLDRINQDLIDQNDELLRQLEEIRRSNRRDVLGVRERTDPRASAYERDYVYDAPRRSSYDDQVVVQPPINTVQTMPERVAASPQPTNRLLPFAIEGPTQAGERPNPAKSTTAVDPSLVAESERYRKQNAALWFIMLCSVGLNFYLAWIARGFYVRYEELADDIRETFTSSM